MIERLPLSDFMTCRYCDKPINDPGVKTLAYWGGNEYRCHAECMVAGERQEAFDCQVIDADCNDCRHFKRLVQVGRNISKGHCLRFDRPETAFPHMSTGRECFEHRRVSRFEIGKPA